MKISELVAELNGHQPDGQVVIQEIQEPDITPSRLYMVESIVKEAGMLPLLMGRRIQSQAARNSLLSDALFQKAFEAHMRGERIHHRATVEKSDDGKYRIAMDGRPVLQEGFETDVEARSFLRGYMLGYETGAAEAK